jgi:hypothetical protein
VQVDSDNVDIALQKRDRSPLLVAEIPFRKASEKLEPDEDERPADDARKPAAPEEQP